MFRNPGPCQFPGTRPGSLEPIGGRRIDRKSSSRAKDDGYGGHLLPGPPKVTSGVSWPAESLGRRPSPQPPCCQPCLPWTINTAGMAAAGKAEGKQSSPPAAIREGTLTCKRQQGRSERSFSWGGTPGREGAPTAGPPWETHFNAKQGFGSAPKEAEAHVNGARLAGATSAECGGGFRSHLQGCKDATANQAVPQTAAGIPERSTQPLAPPGSCTFKRARFTSRAINAQVHNLSSCQEHQALVLGGWPPAAGQLWGRQCVTGSAAGISLALGPLGAS